jgi:hypothetical protein
MSAPAVSESVSGRDQPRWTGEPVIHDVRYYGALRPRPGGIPGLMHPWRRYGLTAECEPCDWVRTTDPGHTAADLTRLAAQHAGIEDP